MIKAKATSPMRIVVGGGKRILYIDDDEARVLLVQTVAQTPPKV